MITKTEYAPVYIACAGAVDGGSKFAVYDCPTYVFDELLWLKDQNASLTSLTQNELVLFLLFAAALAEAGDL